MAAVGSIARGFGRDLAMAIHAFDRGSLALHGCDELTHFDA